MEIFSSILFYITIFLLSIFLYYLSIKKNSSVFKLLSLLVVAIPIGFRFDIGTDYSNYCYLIGYEPIKFTELISSLLLKFGAVINNYQISFLVFSLLTYFFAMESIEIFFEDYHKRIISLIIYLFMFFPHSLNTMRESLAMVVLLYSITLFLKDNNLKKLFLFFVISCLIHNGAIVFFPVLIIFAFRKDIKLIILIFFMLVIMFFCYAIFRTYLPFLDFMSYYLKNLNVDIGFGILAKNIPLFIYIYILNKYNNDQKANIIVFSSFSITGIILRHLSYLNYTFYRFANFYDITNIFLIAYIIDIINYKRKKQFIILVCFFYVLYFIFNFYFMNSGEIFPYQFKFVVN